LPRRLNPFRQLSEVAPGGRINQVFGFSVQRKPSLAFASMVDSGEEIRMISVQISVCARLMVRTNSHSSTTGTVQVSAMSLFAELMTAHIVSLFHSPQ